MDIFLIRHAIAVARGDEAFDHARPLTPKGRTRFERSVRGAKRLGYRFDQVLHSPWVRAAQTADLLLPLLASEHRKEATPLLASTPGPELLSELDGNCCALIGHEPWMSELAALLLFGDITEGDSFRFKKGGMLHLATPGTDTPEPGGAVMQGFFPPLELRRLA